MTSINRREKARQDLRSKILKVAGELFVSEGYQNVTMRGIATRINYSPTTIYLHFRDKADLLRCILEEAQGRLLDKMEAALTGGDPVASLRRGMRLYTEYGLSNPSWYRLSFMSPPEFKPGEYLVDGSKGALLFGGLTAAVQRCIAAGHFRPMDAALAAQVIWAANHGITSLLIGNPHFPWADRNELIAQVIDCTLLGMIAGPGLPDASVRPVTPRVGEEP